MSDNASFEEDAFISYGHIDNEFKDENGKGWVDNLHERLGFYLQERLGYRPKIWRDPRLPGNVDFAYVLEERLGRTCVLVSVLSPAYLKSTWCKGEFKEFCRLAELNGGLRSEGSLRLFKVVKTFVDRDKHPPEFQGQLGYEFFEVDHATGRHIAFNQRLGSQYDQRYWDKLNDLALDIVQVLNSTSQQEVPTDINPFAAATPQGTVYLAETTYDLREARDKIKRELQDRGYRIMPDRELPYKSPEYEQAVRESLRQARLSVHLVGANYGIIPEGSGNCSVVRLQNEIAAERSYDPEFTRLIWLPEGLLPREEPQARFIEYLKTNAHPQRGAELLQTTLEELKSVIEVRLSSNGHRTAQGITAGDAGAKKIYLICDRRDVESVVPVNDFLFRCGYDVLLPLLDDEGDGSAQAMKMHKENLVRCNAVLVHYGSGNHAWFDYWWKELTKAVSTWEGHPPDLYVYITGTPSANKQLFNTREAVVIKNFGEFSPDTLELLLARVKDAENGVEHA